MIPRVARAAAVLVGSAALAGCGAGAPTRPSTSTVLETPAYQAKMRRLAQQRCHRLGRRALARRLHVPNKPAAIAEAYARTWPQPVRAAVRAGCLAALR